jgi:alpha-L-arabinofuranosidase
MATRFMIRSLATGLMTFILAGSSATAADPASISIDVTRPVHRIPDSLWGIFFEDINHAGEGGLYAELVQNRDFEASTIPEGWRVDGTNIYTPLGRKVQKWFANDLPGWSLVAEDGAEGNIALESASPLNDRNPHSLRLTVKKRGGRCGVANGGFRGMNFSAGEWYDLSFYARTETNAHFGVVVSLENEDGRTLCERATLPEVGGDWKKYTIGLHARHSEPRGRLVLELSDPGTIWLDVVSLFPRRTFRNRPNGMRRDVAQLLADLHPAFLRFPGGSVVEGLTLGNRIQWKDTVGDISRRKGGYDLWGYYTTGGLGFHEYLQLAEDLGAGPIYVINSGMSCQSRGPNEIVPDADLREYVQDSLDALEYAMGPATSHWGAQRAANGHPEPFHIQYVEIGNENSGPVYRKHYRLYHDAIKATYPDITTIATSSLQEEPVEFVDDHFYLYPFAFLRMADYYDGADRKGPRIYVGEFAASRGVGRGNLLGALAEAVFMLNIEKNSDVVNLCSYAPLLGNAGRQNPPSSLIILDSSRSAGRSSYQIQKLFNANRPGFVLDTRVRAPRVPVTLQAPRVSVTDSEIYQLYALAGLDSNRGEVVIKVVNPTDLPATASITLKGATHLTGTGRVITLGNTEATAENTLDRPDRILPVETDFNGTTPQFSYRFASNSLTILRLPISKPALVGAERQ